MAGEPDHFIRPLWSGGAFVESGLASRQRRSLRLSGAGLAKSAGCALLSEGLLDCACVDGACDGVCVTIHMAYQTRLKRKQGTLVLAPPFYLLDGATMVSATTK